MPELALLLPPNQDSDDDMKLRDDDKKWLQDEIAIQVAAAISKEVYRFNPHGTRRVARFIREWGIAGTLISVFVALLGIAAAAFYQATARVKEQTKFESDTGHTLEGIAKDIKDIRGELAKQSMVNHAALPLADFKATLPDLASAIATAKRQNVTIPSTVVGGLQEKLTASTDAPDFWTTAANFISYRAFLLVGNLNNWDKPFSPCHGPADMLGADKAASAQLMDPKTGKLGPKVAITRLSEQDCYAELDGRTISEWDCTRCLIKYSGGRLSMKDVNFTDCLFVFVFNSKPVTPDGENLSRSLLASRSGNVSVPAS